jgi:hypothetical protein
MSALADQLTVWFVTPPSGKLSPHFKSNQGNAHNNHDRRTAMLPFDFSTQVANGDPLPLLTTDFLFVVPGQLTAAVNHQGINCWHNAILQMNSAVNAIELTVFNGAGTATISASDAAGAHLETKNVVSAPGPQSFRFDFKGILRLAFVASKGELRLKILA